MGTEAEIPVERFDELFQGEPAEIEQRLVSLRAVALKDHDLSIAPQIESQIALAQAMQSRWDEAFGTLDDAERLPGAALPVARVRLLLERGRVFHQARRMAEAMPWMLASYELSLSNGLDYHAVNAAHMAAIVADDISDRIRWNQIAIDLAETTSDEKAKLWRVVLYNNVGQAYVADKQYNAACSAFQKCERFAALQGNSLLVRGAKWGVARAKRSLGDSVEALMIQQQLLDEYNQAQSDQLLPPEMIGMARGMVYEELAELVPERSAEFAAKALFDLGVNSWFRDIELERWERLQKLAAVQ